MVVRFPAMVPFILDDMGRFMEQPPALIIFDGDCIFCRNYARLLRLREVVGTVELLDARSSDQRILEYQRQGYDLDQGMLFVWKGTIYHGSEALCLLAGMSSSVGWFNKLNAALFSNKYASTILYPLLKLGRRVALSMGGKNLLAASR